MTPCPWWARWYHRRLRRIDREMLLPLFTERAKLRAHSPVGTRSWEHEVEYLTLQAFTLHTQQRGQEHWTCPCAYEDAE